ncbi:non-structural maintenance of chromosomes element 4 homolog A isoform X3 [Jatropha curcas]|uniref:non-structural maintenance of chromosomes element 4 homolog A isoform X3 n=1 Tax=Jatropha curcas TaxID=180498 RepID=UPI0009D6674C|nr:non-structural maintenance of chromosomes element 4 homolog A isoform X3 [Jatropha curcas]
MVGFYNLRVFPAFLNLVSVSTISMTRPAKRERGTVTASRTTGSNNGRAEFVSLSDGPASAGRAALRSRYLAVKNLINGEREDIGKFDSDKFKSVFHEVQSLHQQVQKPREQIVDAEALFGITNSLLVSVKAHGSDGITASDFVSCLLKDFGQQGGPGSCAEAVRDIVWNKIGAAASHVFRTGPGCCTMIGPMDAELKTRKTVVRKHEKPTTSAQPEETVENLFTLSFLVKDGRAEIKVNENGWHLVSPRNAASAMAVASGEVVYRHFVFRLDFKDWQLMASSVGLGEEVMPNRTQMSLSCNSQQDPMSIGSEAGPTTPIRKLSRNRGFILQEETIAEKPEIDT